MLLCKQTFFLTTLQIHTYPRGVHGCDRYAATSQWAFQHFWSDQRPGHSYPQSQYLHNTFSRENCFNALEIHSEGSDLTQGQKPSSLLSANPQQKSPHMSGCIFRGIGNMSPYFHTGQYDIY